MKHKEIPTSVNFEIINVEPMNEFISDCEIKVFYHGKNRNGSYISKAVGNQIANTLPKSPIVAFYNEKIEDYEDHGQEMIINTNGIKIVSKTVPYGAISETAPIVWQEFEDADGVTREYLVCKGFLWTGRYPHLNKVLEDSKAQSMEFFPESITGDWAKFENEDNEFFIFNEANISALCILGDNIEPCFEGSTIGKPEVLYSLKKNEFKQEFNNFMLELDKVLNHTLEEGGRIEVNKEIEENFVVAEDLKSQPALKVDRTAAAMSEAPWGEVNKMQLVKDVMMAANFETIAKDVYMLLESGWQEGKEGACKYPVMELQGDKLVYNRYGLSAGLAYANRLNVTSVADKITAILKKLNVEGYSFDEELDMEDQNYVCGTDKKKKFELEEEDDIIDEIEVETEFTEVVEEYIVENIEELEVETEFTEVAEIIEETEEIETESEFAKIKIEIEIESGKEGEGEDIPEEEIPTECLPEDTMPVEEIITEEYVSDADMVEILKQRILDLQLKCDELENQNSTMSEGYYALQEINKQKLIDAKNMICEKFDILGEEVINPFKENLDNYTLDELDEKLSAIAFKAGINFNLITEKQNGIITPSPQNVNNKNVPAWVQAVEERVKNK